MLYSHYYKKKQRCYSCECVEMSGTWNILRIFFYFTSFQQFLVVFALSRSSSLTTKLKKDVNRDFHIASSPILQSFFFEKVRCLILASSQRKLRGHIEFLKCDITIRKNTKIQIHLKFKGLNRFSQNLVSNITQYYNSKSPKKFTLFAIVYKSIQ